MKISTRTLSSFAAVLGMSFSLMAAETVSMEWANLFDGTTTAGDQSTAVLGVKNGAYWLNTLGSTESAPDLFYAGTKIFTGALYVGTSQNNNFALTKTDADGKALWTIYSTSGDYAANEGALAEAADGSVIFLSRARHTDGMLDKPLNLVDASGKTFEFGGTVENRYYIGVIGKTDANGNIQWIRLITPDNTKTVGGETVNLSDVFTAKSLVLDAEGNIYVAGGFSAPLAFAKAENATEKITPRNSAEWAGKGTAPADSYIAKLGADGYYKASVQTEGDTFTTDAILSMTIDGANLYVTGTATAEEGLKASFGGEEFTATTLATPFIASFSTATLEAEWLKTLTPGKVEDKYGYQNPALSANGATLWLTALFNGSFTDGTKTISSVTPSTREGLLVKFDKATGEWLAAADSRADWNDTALGGYLAAVQNPADDSKVYVYGYVMNAATGAYLRGYNAQDLTPVTDENWILVKGGGVPTAICFKYLPEEGTAYLTVRGNKAFEPLGLEATAAPTGWAVMAGKLALPEGLTAGVEAAATAAEYTVLGGKGCITISAAEACTTAVYDLAGRAAATVKLAAGETATLTLAPGLYIAGGKKVIVK